MTLHKITEMFSLSYPNSFDLFIYSHISHYFRSSFSRLGRLADHDDIPTDRDASRASKVDIHTNSFL